MDKKIIIVTIKSKEISIELLDSKENILFVDRWEDRNNILELFFDKLDLLFDKFKLNSNIVKYKLIEENPKGYTTTRILRTLVKGLNY